MTQLVTDLEDEGEERKEGRKETWGRDKKISTNRSHIRDTCAPYC